MAPVEEFAETSDAFSWARLARPRDVLEIVAWPTVAFCQGSRAGVRVEVQGTSVHALFVAVAALVPSLLAGSAAVCVVLLQQGSLALLADAVFHPTGLRVCRDGACGAQGTGATAPTVIARAARFAGGRRIDSH